MDRLTPDESDVICTEPVMLPKEPPSQTLARFIHLLVRPVILRDDEASDAVFEVAAGWPNAVESTRLVWLIELLRDRR